ncbi:GDNF family receptor alpha-like [Xyrauchen texanus]|uniref:GDNF family receptor alpha-like n=1 Tax=Xyrauchen texanus TaxID=154827 RepID=UPI002242B757|nr:GDNF family receptor alpha-like [Xyrauchen texanus]
MRAMKAALLIVSHLLYQVICINTSTSPDCISHMDACVSPSFCRNEQVVFRNICDFKDGSCRMTDAKVCNSNLQMMLTRAPLLGECLCSGLDPCSTLQQLYSQCKHHLAQKRTELKQEWQTNGHSRYVRHTNRSCLEEIIACIEDEDCNRQMVPFVQACSTQCDPSECRQAIGKFYSNLPHDVAESLVFCDCEREDPECQQMKTSIHFGSCISDEMQTPMTCLEELDSCAGDTLCRQTFNRYLSECFGAVEAPYGEHSTSEWLQHLDPDFFLGEEHECRVAFVATMGSILHNPCTCDGLRHHHQHKCNELQHMFQNKSVFKFSGTQKTFKEKTSDKSSIEQQPTNQSSIEQQPTNTSSIEQQWLSDQFLYLLIYISLLMVVVLFAISLAIHRLRRIHQAAGKASFEANQTKSLMLSPDNI